MRVAIVVAALLLAGGSAGADQMVMYGVASHDSFVELGREGGVGNVILWHAELQDDQGAGVGTTTGSCIQVAADATQVCNIVLNHEGHGRINLNGMQVAPPGTSTLTIVGGTEAYEGARGTIKTTPVENRARYKYEIDYRTDGVRP